MTHDISCLEFLLSLYCLTSSDSLLLSSRDWQKKGACLQCLAVILHLIHEKSKCLEMELSWMSSSLGCVCGVGVCGGGGGGGYSHYHMPIHAIHSSISEHRPTSTILLSHLDQEQAENSHNYLIISFLKHPKQFIFIFIKGFSVMHITCIQESGIGAIGWGS